MRLLPISEKQIDRALDIAERAVAAFEERNRIDGDECLTQSSTPASTRRLRSTR